MISNFTALTPSPLPPFFEQCRFGIKVLERRLRGYTPKVRIQIESHRYLVKTVESWEEWLGVLRLRHEVFHQETLGRNLLLGIDIDDIDFHCDSLAIIDRLSREIVATYRLTTNTFSPRFYSQNKFELGDLLKEPGTQIELGRACVRVDARNGSTLQLLWRGISAYMEAMGAVTLFGSTGIRSRDPRDAAAVCRYLIEQGHFASIPEAHPHSNYAFETLQAILDAMPASEVFERAHQAMPPLFLSYLKAGAKVVCPPALNEYLGSTEFLTVLRTKEMKTRFDRRYGTSYRKAG